ncbi:hypothetical protein DSO57_1012070 [Entomophthora muscae]|uniref:Uncharacterized protein n=1 Tax=Entomophthora muscae TaxID=34485 RepID=A0ACC2RXC1_9FUNG|nr:hypothetical protein DSO57_1012070 [Entomophthora muscae]
MTFCSHLYTLVAHWVSLDGVECVLPSAVPRVLSLVPPLSGHPSTPLGGILLVHLAGMGAKLKLSLSNAARALLHKYQIDDLVLYYQNCTGGRAHKLDSLWVGPCKVTFKKGVEYTVKLLSSRRPFARVHSKFLCKYQSPVSNLEGVNVVNCAINAISIWPLNNDDFKDLTGFAFKFGNSLPSVNGSVPISTHFRNIIPSLV